MTQMMVSADDHIDLGYLPRELWTERLPSSLRERGPRVVEVDGAPNQLLPVAQLFPEDPEASTREVCRAAALGFKQVHFLVGTVTPAMYQPAWDRFWDAAEEGGRPPAFNMGVGNGGTMFFEPFVGLFAFGVLERHPRLKFVLGESGTGWIPYVVQELDYRFVAAQQRSPRNADFPLKRPPSEVFKEQRGWRPRSSKASSVTTPARCTGSDA